MMSHAKSVFIKHDLIADYARRVVAEMPRVTTLDSKNHLVVADNPAATLAYVLSLDSINFGSGVFVPAQNAGLDLEYSVVAQSLKRKMQYAEWTDIVRWRDVTADDCHDVFGLAQGACLEVDWLMGEFARHLQLTASHVQKDFGSLDVMLTADGKTILSAVAAWPHFKDETSYQGRAIAIYKRAQILVADLALALPQHKFGGVDLTCFADNMVPHVLRTDGILEYAPDLAAKIDAGALIEAGSAEEAELRCAAIHVVSLMQQALNKSDISDVNLDHMLWHRGYLPGFSELKPHRTITTNY